MVATLQSRKEALEAKIAEKTAELKLLCLQEADLTGTLPPETPLEPGEPPPTIRKRVGTSFSFPQSLINKLNNSDTLGALELECKVQTNIAEAALALANDPNASKSVRRKHRLMYRQSQRNLADLETRLSLLKQGRHQVMKPQQIKKKPRPNTIDHSLIAKELKTHKNYLNDSSWSAKQRADDELRRFSSLKTQRSSGTSHSSNSPYLSARELAAFNSSGLPEQCPMTSSISHPNIQDLRHSTEREIKRNERRSSGRGTRQWDTQSAGGTLLPNQTYPESHQPNLNRAHSLGNVKQEKEWYETALDSAPSPPLRTSSRLPTSVRMHYHLKEMQIRDAVNRSLNSPKPHPLLTRTVRSTPVDELNANLQGMHIASVAHHRHLENYTPPDEMRYFDSRVDSRLSADSHTRLEDLIKGTRHTDHLFPSNRLPEPSFTNSQDVNYSLHGQFEARRKSYEPSVESQNRGSYTQRNHFDRANSSPVMVQYDPDNLTVESRAIERPKYLNLASNELGRSRAISESDGIQNTPGSVYINIPDEVDATPNTQPYFHGDSEKRQNAYFHTATPTSWTPSIPGLPEIVPPHAVTQEEIQFDTVVPFESPQNHTVVQAGIWQPYREVTKPFEMSDFYKYSTKFRQARQSPAQSPGPVVGVYQPLRPMTCQPVERRPPPEPPSSPKIS